jgi:hypothetical protein
MVVFLDYDGTLSPIVDDPDQAFMTDAVCILSDIYIYTLQNSLTYIYICVCILSQCNSIYSLNY